MGTSGERGGKDRKMTGVERLGRRKMDIAIPVGESELADRRPKGQYNQHERGRSVF